MDRVTLHNFCATKHDSIDDLFTYLTELKWISSKDAKANLKDTFRRLEILGHVVNYAFQMFVSFLSNC